jgi:hypothetical protein
VVATQSSRQRKNRRSRDTSTLAAGPAPSLQMPCDATLVKRQSVQYSLAARDLGQRRRDHLVALLGGVLITHRCRRNGVTQAGHERPAWHPLGPPAPHLICRRSWNRRSGRPKGLAGLAIGLTLTLIHLISIPSPPPRSTRRARRGSRSSTVTAHPRSAGCSGWHR